MVSNVKIFEITIPEKNNLCCAICRIVNRENEFLFYPNVCFIQFKCRQFIQEIPQALTAPVTNRKLLQTGAVMYVIVTKDFFEDYKFQELCDELNVQVMSLSDPIPTYVYRACLLHTIKLKLAPQWNKVGVYLVEGQNFLSSTGNVNAIIINIKRIQGNSAQLQMEAVNLQIPFVRLNTARPAPQDMQPPVRVLPSMKMANVLNVSKTINKQYPFKNYQHLQSYWKDVHGYVLPDHTEGSLFYDIEFFYFNLRVFVYPETCLASGPPRVLPPSMDLVSIIYRFVGELRGRVSRLCDQQLDVSAENACRAALQLRTPKTGKFSGYDTGYATGYSISKTINSRKASPFRVSDTHEIPSKQMKMTLTRTGDSLKLETDLDDFDLGLGTTCSSNASQKQEELSELLTLLDNDDDFKSIVSTDESKSHYFDDSPRSRPINFTLRTNIADFNGRTIGNQNNISYKKSEETDKEERPNKLSLREKLSKALGKQ